MGHRVIYESSKHGITKDGHTMFHEDVIADLNRKSFLEAEKKERDDLLQRIFDYHISHGFGDDGSFESFADEITNLI